MGEKKLWHFVFLIHHQTYDINRLYKYIRSNNKEEERQIATLCHDDQHEPQVKPAIKYDKDNIKFNTKIV